MPKISFFKSMFTRSSKQKIELDNAKQVGLHNLVCHINNTDCRQILSYDSDYETRDLKSILNNIENSEDGKKILKKTAKSIKKHDKYNVPDIKIKDGTANYIARYLSENIKATSQYSTLNQLLSTHKPLCKAITINPQLSVYLKSLTSDRLNHNMDTSELLETISTQVNKHDQKKISRTKNKALFCGVAVGGFAGAAIGGTAGLVVGATVDLGLFGSGMGIPTASSTILGTIGGGVFGALTGGFTYRKYKSANVYANLIQQYKQLQFIPSPYTKQIIPPHPTYGDNTQPDYNGMGRLQPQQTANNPPVIQAPKPQSPFTVTPQSTTLLSQDSETPVQKGSSDSSTSPSRVDRPLSPINPTPLLEGLARRRQRIPSSPEGSTRSASPEKGTYPFEYSPNEDPYTTTPPLKHLYA